jgi:Zn-dependent M28 family amino/carboxypeptidase
VEQQLRAAGYEPVRQYFDFAYFEELSPGSFSAGGTSYVDVTDFDVMDYSGSTGGLPLGAPIVAVNDNIVPVDQSSPASTSDAGCDAEDFADADFTGAIALIQRGTCDFAVKVANAEAAGAIGVIIFNEGQDALDRSGVLLGTLGAPSDIPVIGTTYAIGAALTEQLMSGPVQASITTNTISETRTTFNVIAETDTGRTDRVVVVGAHLDSVAEGPGINDNGSGSAAILEIAQQIADIDLTNQVRFIWFGAEESGLLGAEYYVSQLSARERKDIAVNLNFDMLGSPNFARFIYDGDGSATGVSGPNGSGNVERVFTEYFASQGLYTEETEFDGRSDYGPFIDAGIPAGGLFSGAEGIKTEEQAQPDKFGGEANVAYDVCYHSECDDLSNISFTGLDQLADAAAHAVLPFAETTSAVNGTGKASKGNASSTAEFKGHNLKR